jgi:hypothetical protein
VAAEPVEAWIVEPAMQERLVDKVETFTLTQLIDLVLVGPPEVVVAASQVGQEGQLLEALIHQRVAAEAVAGEPVHFQEQRQVGEEVTEFKVVLEGEGELPTTLQHQVLEATVVQVGW